MRRLGLSIIAGVWAFSLSALAAAAPLVIDGSAANACTGGSVIANGCQYGGTQTFDYIELKNGAVLSVTPYDGVDKAATGNLVLRATGLDPTNTFSIKVDRTSRITAKGGGYQATLCDDGPGSTTTSGGRGGCSVLDSGGGGAHFGKGGRGTKDSPGAFPAGYEEDCGSKTGNACTGVPGCRNGDGLPSIAGDPFVHHVLDPDFGSAGGDKGCNDGDGFTSTGSASALRGGNGGGRVVLFAANPTQTGVVIIDGRIMADGNRGCAQGNDSGGAGAGGTVVIIGDIVTASATARVSAHGGIGGDSQPKCLPCNQDSDCTSTDQYQGGVAVVTGQKCVSITDPQSGTTSKRCGPCNCAPCTVNSQCNAALGQTCKAIPNIAGTVCADSGNNCTPFDPGDDERECKDAQNLGLCDDCGGAGGGGIINVYSRVGNLHAEAIFDVRGGRGGVCPVCTGESGGGAGELQLDGAYVGEICDGKDNDFNGMVDDGLPQLTCPSGNVPSCVGGKPQTCPVDPITCQVPAKDSSPRFSLIVDTSGSMLLDTSGNPLFGDGSAEYPGVTTGNAPRLFIAKNAVSKVLAAFPENGYSLSRYYQDVGIRRSCQSAQNFECAGSCCTYDSPDDNVAPTYPSTSPGNTCVLRDIYAGANYPNTPTFNSNMSIGWPAPGNNDCINYAGSCGPPERGAQVLVGFDQPLSRYLSWLDHKESNFKEAPGDAEGNRCPGGDCELRGTGPTPLAGSLLATKAYLDPIISCDQAKTCRKYATILLTDGVESCETDPNAPANAAAALLASGVKTYVIGFSVLPAERAKLNAVATAGGTNAAQFTGGVDAAFFATSEQALADAMASIVSSSQVFEVCNDLDDNCNGLVDETFPDKGKACDNGKTGACRVVGKYVCDGAGTGTVCDVAGNAGPAPGVEVCNGIDDNCNGQIDEGLSCGCLAAPEICNGKDDDCDGIADNPLKLVDVGKPCGRDTGECKSDLTVCTNGKLECPNAVGPKAETCNGLDDDCDGVVDGMTKACYGGPAGTDGKGICHAGLQKCNAMPGGAESYGACVGEVGPTAEICDGLDNDCNGKIDDGVSDGAGHATGDKCCAFGTKCGIGTCTQGTYQCQGNAVVCLGGVGPASETCDGLDNDCNGKVDDIPGLGLACTQQGGCAGVLACDTMKKMVVCASPTTLQLEVCNGLDDNCNGKIDEEPDVSTNDPKIGKACDVPKAPNDKAPCKAGKTVCKGGAISCEGSFVASMEICDGVDNDCDGMVDVNAPCPTGSQCKSGQCVSPCVTGEFNNCPGGFDCKMGFCFPTSCDNVTCPSGKKCEAGVCVVDPTGGAGAGGAGGGAGAGGKSGAAGSAGKAGGAGSAGATGGGGGSTGGAAGTAGSGGAEGGKAGSSAGSAGATSAGAAGSSATAGTTSGTAGKAGATPTNEPIFGLTTGGGGCSVTTDARRENQAGWLAALAAFVTLGSRRRTRKGGAA